MVITFTTLVIWLLIAALVGIVGELIARRRAPDGLLGAIILGFIAIVAAIACTWWVSQSSVAAKSAGIYFVVLSVAYLLVRKKEA